MADDKGPDEKVICVPVSDPIWNKLNDLSDVNPHLIKEIEHFFQVYKDLENKKVDVEGWGDVNEAKEIKWQDVEVGDSANVTAINKTGLIIKTYGRKFHLKFPNGTTKTYDANELNFVKNESVTEESEGLWANIRAKRARGEKPAPKNSKAYKDAVKAGKEINKNESVNENRWLALKNDESMHPNKKLAVGLKELKHQLSEVETFLRWYNQIKTMNELDSNQYWKRTNSHIYKIKERIINIARTLQEIEK